MKPVLLVVEDASEYAEFARLFLSDVADLRTAQSGAEALAVLGRDHVDAVLMDLRFDRSPREALIGDVDDLAKELFGGDKERAARYMQDQQGALIVAEIRARGHKQPIVFVHDFPGRRLANLRRLYGEVFAVPSFDAGAIRQILGLRPTVS